MTIDLWDTNGPYDDRDVSTLAVRKYTQVLIYVHSLKNRQNSIENKYITDNDYRYDISRHNEIVN